MQNIELTSIKPINSSVLVKFKTTEHDSFQTKVGMLYLNPAVDPEKHMNVVVEIVRVPEKLKYTGVVEGKPSWLSTTMPWDTDVVIKPGDRAWIDWNSMLLSIKKSGRFFETDGEKYAFIHYRDIYLVKRGEEVIMCNGYCLFKPIKEDDLPESLKPKHLRQKVVEIPDSVKNKESSKYAKVLYVGAPNKGYVNPELLDIAVVNPGDFCILEDHYGIPLEYYLHRCFSDELLYAAQRTLINGILK